MLTQVVNLGPPNLTMAPFVMPVLSPGSDGMFIDHIDGLGPVNDNITTKPFGSGDGEYFVGRHREKRNLVFHFGFQSRGYDVAEARENLIRSFYTVGDTVFVLRFDFDDRDSVQIEGYLESEDADRFVSDPDATLSVICPKPNFTSVTPMSATGETDHDPDLTDLTNPGNREVGIIVKITPDVGIEDNFANDLIAETKIESSPGVYHTYNTLHVNAYTADLDNPMVAGEEYWIDTRVGKKSIYIYNPSTLEVRNAMRNMTSDSRWPKLYPGTSKFSIAIDYWAQGVHPQAWTAYWYPEYGSI